MEKTTFLLDTDSILDKILEKGLDEAKARGANHGAVAAAIVYGGRLILKAGAICGEVKRANRVGRICPEDPRTGINDVGVAIERIMQSLRTGTFSGYDDALVFGESATRGSCGDTVTLSPRMSEDGRGVTFRLLCAYSGMLPDESLKIAKLARQAGRDEVRRQYLLLRPEGAIEFASDPKR